MEGVVEQLQAYPPEKSFGSRESDADNDKAAKLHVQSLQKADQSVWSDQTDVLELLDPAVYSISYLFVLLSRIRLFLEQSAEDPSDEDRPKNKRPAKVCLNPDFRPDHALWQRVDDFSISFDAVQVRYCGHELRSLIEFVAESAIVATKPEVAIVPIRRLMLRVDPSGATFTTSHTLYVKLCLASRCYRAATLLLDLPIYYFPSQSGKINDSLVDPSCPFLCSKHESSASYISTWSGLTGKFDAPEYLQYFLLGAMCYMALERWQRAHLFLEAVVVAPSSGAVSRIQLAAYQKLVFLWLIRHGKSCELPRLTNPHVQGLLNRASRLYTTIGEIFEQGIRTDATSDRLVSEVETAESRLSEDGNLGLARLVVAAYRKFRVLKLTQVYLTLSVAEITRRIMGDGADEDEMRQYLASLIESGGLAASLTQIAEQQDAWMIKFLPPDTAPTGVASLQAHAQRIQQLNTQLRLSQRRLVLGKEYAQSLAKANKTTASAKSAAAFEAYDDMDLAH